MTTDAQPGAVTTTTRLPILGRRVPTRRPRRRKLIGLLFVAPAVILFAVYGVYTVVYGFLLSFARWNGFSPDWTWVGLQNFIDLFGGNKLVSPTIWQAAGVTLVVMVALPVAVVILGLVLALLLNSITRLRGFLRTIYFIPYVTAGIAVYYAWRFMYQPDGGVNAVLTGLGLGALAQPDGFLGSPDTALLAVTIVMIWGSVPIAILLFLTGLQTIDDSILEAAEVDGAGPFRRVWSVILPLLNPITALVIIIMLREALQNFQLFLLMTNGGPVNSTNTLGLQTYTFAFGSASDLGYASALGWSLAAVAVVLAVVNLRVLRSRA